MTKNICSYDANATVHYNVKADKAAIWSVTLENVKQCLDDMGLDFSKYHKFKAFRLKHEDSATVNELESLQRSNDCWPALWINGLVPLQ